MTTFTKNALYAFAIALFLQGAHMIEHFAQLYQYQILRMPIYEAHGILFFLDLEYNHFWFNLLYALALAYVFVAGELFKRKAPEWARWTFIAGFAIQSYHVLEHTSRIGQTLQTGCEPCPGILGWYVNGIHLHFTLNSITWLLPMIAFFGYGLHKNFNRNKPS